MKTISYFSSRKLLSGFFYGVYQPFTPRLSFSKCNYNAAKKRKVEILVLSDVHLGTYGCHAKQLLSYLKSIKPKMVVLNGDIIDIWQFISISNKYDYVICGTFISWK